MKAVAYYRVSTAAQGRSGLGLEAQRGAVSSFCETRGWAILAEYTEIESGARKDRPELSKALHRAKLTGSTLVIAKLDRLSRNAAFLLTLRDSGAKFIAADMPEASNLTIGILALVAEQEREAISQRTKAALEAAKARGTKLGNPNGAEALQRAGKGNAAAVDVIKSNADAVAADLAETIAGLQASGVTGLAGIAAALNAQGIVTPRGGLWHPTSVKRLLERISRQ